MALAFVFPGHGSQLIGMLNSISSRPQVQHLIKEASDTLDQDFGKLITQGPVHVFSQLHNASPITLIAGISLYSTWIEHDGPVPSVLAGHSHGEYSALVASGVISFKDAISIVRLRAEEMLKVKGRVAVIIGISSEKIIELCASVKNKTGKVVEASNFNAPGQVLVSGEDSAVAMVCDACDSAGAKFTKILPLQVPTHSSLLSPVSEKLQEYFKQVEFSTPTIPVINNVDVSILSNPMDIKDAMARQVSSPVKWQKIIEGMSARGVRHIVECGPGNILTELIARIDNSLQCMAIKDQESISETIQTLNGIK